MGAMTGYEPVVDVSMLVRRPATQVWEAFVDPKQIRQFWLAESSARLTVGATAHWVFKVKGSETDVEVVESDPGRLLLLRGMRDNCSGIEFDDRGDATLVRVYLDGFDGEDAAGQAIDAVSGFTLVLSSLKIWLEHGIDSQLMYDRFPDAAYNDR